MGGGRGQAGACGEMDRLHFRLVGFVFAQDKRDNLRNLLRAENRSPRWHSLNRDSGRNGRVNRVGTASVQPNFIDEVWPDAARQLFAVTTCAVTGERLLTAGDNGGVPAHLPESIVIELIGICRELRGLDTIELVRDERL